MTKGVNKQIIEISDTGSQSFERAILFVRPQSKGFDKQTLDRDAKDYLLQVRLRPSIYARMGFWETVGRVLLGVILGAGITAGILLRLLIA